MEKNIDSFAHLEKIKEESPSVLFYFSQPECNVCKQLKPKIIDLLKKEFPKTEFYYVNIKDIPEAGGQYSVFAVPTIIVYFEGREFMRYGRNLGINQLREDLERPYGLFFEQ